MHRTKMDESPQGLQTNAPIDCPAIFTPVGFIGLQQMQPPSF